MKLQRASILLVLGALLFALTPAVAPAQVMVSNLSEETFASSPVSTNFWFASRFRTNDSALSYTLGNVVLSLAAPTNTSSSLFVAIYSNAGGLPVLEGNDQPLEVLSGNTSPTSAGEYTFTSSGLTLDAEVSYWIVVGVASGDGSYAWNVTESSSYTGDWRIPTTATHAHSFEQGGDWEAEDGYARQFSVSITAVPEPAHIALLASGVALGLVALRRRRA